MTADEIAAAVAEAAPRIVGGALVRVREPLPGHLALEVRHGGRNLELVIGVADGLARIHLARDLPPTPPGPSPFCLRARKRLRPGRVTALFQVPGDRVVFLRVSQHRDQEGPWQSTLVAELFGRGRLFLLDDRERVLACTGPGGPRGLMPGEPYRLPEGGGAEGRDGAVAAIDGATLEARYAAWLAAAARDGAARDAARRLDAERRRIGRRIANLERDLARLRGWEAVQREAELLAGHRHLLTRGMARVTVTDWFDPACPPREIALDPALAPEDNVAARFRKAKRARGGIATVAERLARDREALARLDAGAGMAPEPPAEPAPRGGAHGFRRFASVPGWHVYVGRSATDNDRLTFRLARGNDLWFHARDAPGSHVLLRGDGGAPPQRAIHDAALLAAHFSRLKTEGGGEVMFTPRKYLRRPKGGNPGQVLVTQEKVLAVNLETADMAALLARRE